MSQKLAIKYTIQVVLNEIVAQSGFNPNRFEQADKNPSFRYGKVFFMYFYFLFACYSFLVHIQLLRIKFSLDISFLLSFLHQLSCKILTMFNSFLATQNFSMSL